jgi:cell wall-associated NlpC family hydrolase
LVLLRGISFARLRTGLAGRVVKSSPAPFAAMCAAACVLALVACAPPGPRPAYSRESGTWVSFENEDYSPDAPPEDLHRPRASESELRKVAESYLKVPYRYGGKSRKGMDCSGFVQQVFEEAFKLRLPRSSAAMARYGKDVDKEDLKPGDLVFFKRIRIDHVGIYMGDGYFIHSQSGLGVTYTKLDAHYFSKHYAEAKRVIN